MKKINKKVLFFNAVKKKGAFRVDRIHMGLTLLGQILSKEGCQVKVIDYAFINGLRGQIKTPSIEETIREFRPDVIGVSVFTYLYDECQMLIEEILRRVRLVGQPGGRFKVELGWLFMPPAGRPERGGHAPLSPAGKPYIPLSAFSRQIPSAA